MGKSAEHTPTPWTNHEHNFLSHDVAHISGPHGCAIVMVHSGTENINPGREHIVSRDEAKANAAFIVRAVNSHAALVEALEARVTELSVYYDGRNDENADDDEALSKASAALTLAKGA